MVSEDFSGHLRGRLGECEVLDRLCSVVEGGHSSVLVVRGEAGIGKSSLLAYLAGRAREGRVVRGSGVESEMELPFAGLHQLCAPLLGSLEQLPGPQKEALATAFGLSTGPPPDRFLVGLAVLSLLSDAAGEGPLFCLVDDAQWLDEVSAQTLAFVARRLLAEPVGLVLASREPVGQGRFAGLPELSLEGLDDSDARALLDSATRGQLDTRISDRVVNEARGNPLALLELPREVTGSEPADGFGPPDLGPTAHRIEQSFVQQVRSLPPTTQRILLIAAAEPVGDAVLLWRAAEQLGIERGAAAPAEAAGMIDIGALVRFRHPLLRSAVYRSAGLAEKQSVHRVLAEVAGQAFDLDRRAWHLAWATLGPDESVAAELESSAERAQARGGVAAAAALLVRAAVLTPEPALRAARAVAAAQAKLRAGATDSAQRLLLLAEGGHLTAFDRARVDLLHAQIKFASNRGNEVSALLLVAADRLVPLDAALARETFLDALSAAMFVGRLATGHDIRTMASTVREAHTEVAPEELRPDFTGLLLNALSVRFAHGHREAVVPSRQAVQALLRETDTGRVLRWSWLTSAVAADMWDAEGWAALAARHVRTARAVGALGELPLALNSHVVVHLFAGELDAAAQLVAEIPPIQEAVGDLAPYGALGLAAWRGDESRAEDLIQAGLDDAASRGEGVGVSIAQWARAVLHNGLGHYGRAREAAELASAHAHDLAATNWGLTELVEAAVRSDERLTATVALERLTERTDPAGTDWALGSRARAHALLAERDAAESLYREAIERLGRTPFRMELARAHLLYGEWLRREQRRVDARSQLRMAHEMFTRFGADAFARRAGRELRALGETVTIRVTAAPVELTAQEAQIAGLARDGLTNPEIGAQLFLSPHTVEWHLRKVFAKLAITSRRQLRTALADTPTAKPA
ncbi:ATP-binding protein [Streptomyces phaeoluteigriseus]